MWPLIYVKIAILVTWKTRKLGKTYPPNTPKLSFPLVSGSEITKILSTIDSKKSTGADNIAAQIVKSCISPISGVLAILINTTVQHGKFPVSLKGAQIAPIHKIDPLNKENHRPVIAHILLILSTAYMRVMHYQLSDYFNDIFNPFLAAFRKGFGCKSTQLRLLEDRRMALDNQLVSRCSALRLLIACPMVS